MPFEVLCSMTSSCGACWGTIKCSRDRQVHLGLLKKSGFCVAFHSGFWIAAEIMKGTRRCNVQKPPKNRS